MGWTPHQWKDLIRIAVRRKFGLPENAQNYYAACDWLQPGTGKSSCGGWLALAEIVHEEHFGRRWQSQGKSVDLSS